MDKVSVHPRVLERHPELSEDAVREAWQTTIRSVPRLDKEKNEYIAVGFDNDGRLIEMIAICSTDGDWLIYHAMTPPAKKTLLELGMLGR